MVRKGRFGSGVEYRGFPKKKKIEKKSPPPLSLNMRLIV